MVTAESVALFNLENHWGRGVLPRAGGLYDQPNGLIEAMDAIGRARASARPAGE